MKKIIFVFICSIISNFGIAQNDYYNPETAKIKDSIAYSQDYEFKEGIYLTIKQFLENKPVTKENIVTAIPKDRLDFFSQLFDLELAKHFLQLVEL